MLALLIVFLVMPHRRSLESRKSRFLACSSRAKTICATLETPPSSFRQLPTVSLHYIGDSSDEACSLEEFPAVPAFPFKSQPPEPQPIHFFPVMLTVAEVTEVQNFMAAVVARRSVSQLDPDSAMPDDAKSVNPDEAKSVNPDAQSVSADESFPVVAESVNSDAEIFLVDAENVKLGLSKSVNPDVTEKSVMQMPRMLSLIFL